MCIMAVMSMFARREIIHYKNKLEACGVQYHVIAKGGVDSHLEIVQYHLQSYPAHRVVVMLDFDGVFVSPWHSLWWTLVSVLTFLRLMPEAQVKRQVFYRRTKNNIVAFTHIAQQAQMAVIWTKRIILPHSRSLFNSLLRWLAQQGGADSHVARFPFIDHDTRRYLRQQAGVAEEKIVFVSDKSPHTCSDIILDMYKTHTPAMVFFVGSGHFDRVVIDTFITEHPDYASRIAFFDTGHWLM